MKNQYACFSTHWQNDFCPNTNPIMIELVSSLVKSGLSEKDAWEKIEIIWNEAFTQGGHEEAFYNAGECA